MARILVVEDDPDQLAVRKLTLEAAGHRVETARGPSSAMEMFDRREPEMVIMDLRLPRLEDGLGLIRKLRGRSAAVRIVVLSGWATDLAEAPERELIDQCLEKPVRSRQLLALIGRAVLLCAAVLLLAGRAHARDFPFHVGAPAEVVADLDLAAPGANWGEPGREAALAAVTLDGAARQNVMVYTGPETHRYTIFLGSVGAGEHRLTIERDARYSAPGAGLEAAGAAFREIRSSDPYYQPLAHAPVLYARRDTIGRFSDVPMIVYCERLEDSGRPLLEYTIIYSNEDGGTSTRALMARWGRTTDIDFGYRAWLDPAGTVVRATIQAKDHQEPEFHGRREGAHPVLLVSTDNNMVSDEGVSAIRYQLAPLVADLSQHSREQVMDEQPFTYRIMAEELTREKKLRPFGTVENDRISDPRNYLYLELKVANHETAVSALVKRRGEDAWRSSDLGRLDYAIDRDGWVRTTIELPPGTTPADLDSLAFQCLVAQDEKGRWPQSDSCRVEAVSKSFLLGRDYRPGPNVWVSSEPMVIPSGEIRTLATPRKQTKGTISGTRVR